MTESITALDALITGFWEGSKDLGRLCTVLDDIACELEPLDEAAAAMAGSHAIDASNLELRLDLLGDKLRAQRDRAS
ncbi:hypothetical protein [Amycolatopsis sp. NPDC004378]